MFKDTTPVSTRSRSLIEGSTVAPADGADVDDAIVLDCTVLAIDALKFPPGTSAVDQLQPEMLLREVHKVIACVMDCVLLCMLAQPVGARLK